MYVSWTTHSHTQYFDNEERSNEFLDVLKSIHPALRFTCEHEQSNNLPFLDVLVEKSE